MTMVQHSTAPLTELVDGDAQNTHFYDRNHISARTKQRQKQQQTTQHTELSEEQIIIINEIQEARERWRENE